MIHIIKKEKVFQKEIGWIKTGRIAAFARKAVGLLPDYFFDVAASSSGKYHPAYALGSGGLVRHTKAAVHIAHDLLELEQNQSRFTQETRDCFLAALILHDGWKHGSDGKSHTVSEHPTVAADWVRNTPEFKEFLGDDMLSYIADLIASHMGQWNTDFRSKKEILPKPITEGQQFVHLCDYLASRKYLVLDFGDEYFDVKDYEVNDLENRISEILAVCKSKVSSDSAKREELYRIITENNDGRRNPNSIKELAVADKVLALVKEV